MHFFLKGTTVLLIALSILIKPLPVSAEFLEVTSPAEIYQDTAFEIDVRISAQPNQNYKIKARIGKISSQMNKGQTFDETNGVWLSDTVSWDKFPSFQTNSEGSWNGKLKVKPTTTASLGNNLLQVRIQKPDDTGKYSSPTYNITILNNTVAETETPKQTPVIKVEGKAILSEFMAQPSDKIEWVEIRNDGDNPADISGWKVDDEEGKSSPQEIPDSTIIQPKGYFVVNFTSYKLNDLADSVRLLRPDGSVADSFIYEKTVKGQSWSKDSNGNWFITNEATPNSENKFTYVSETPNPPTAPNQKPETVSAANVLAAKSDEPITKVSIPTINKSAKIATVSSSFVNKQNKGGVTNLILLAAGFLLILSSVGILFKNNLRKFFKKEKAVLQN